MRPDYLTPTADPAVGDPGAWGAHDPTVLAAREGGWLMFSTDTAVAGGPGVGVQIRGSDDLVSWRWLGHAFDGVPAEAVNWTQAVGVWAPEVVRRGDEYRMYYSASSFGSRTSMIALATAPEATGPWTHVEPIVTTLHDVDAVNAIDAAVVVDDQGGDWLLYGSFFGGLRILRLTPDGRPAIFGDTGTPVVVRPGSLHGAVEGGHILLDEESAGYALFCSFDSLFDTYNVRIARADKVTGPYRDAAGRDMVNASEPPTQAGTVIVAGYVTPDGTHWAAPGHSSHLVTDQGRFLVHHVRDGGDPMRHTAQIRRLGWTSTGWPLASPLPYGGQVAWVPEDLSGDWFVYELTPGAPTPIRPRLVRVTADDLAGLTAERRGRVALDARALDAVLFVEAEGVAVAGLDEQGVVLWGIRA